MLATGSLRTIQSMASTLYASIQNARRSARLASRAGSLAARLATSARQSAEARSAA